MDSLYSPLVQRLPTSWWAAWQLSRLIHILAHVYRNWWGLNPGLPVPHDALRANRLSNNSNLNLITARK